MNWREILFGGLLLPLRIYLQPWAFLREVGSMVLDMPDNYSLWQARHKLRESDFRRHLLTLCAQFFIAQSWPFLIGLILKLSGVYISWRGVAFGVAFGVALGIAGGVALAGGVVVGVAFGVACGFFLGVALGPVRPVRRFAIGLAIGVALGLAIGVALGLTRGVAEGAAFSASFCILFLRLLPFLLEILLSLLSGAALQFRTAPAEFLWRICPVRWDEVILLPLPGLAKFLAELYRASPEMGSEAINQTAAHQFQSRAAARALLLLAQHHAEAVSSPSLLGAFGEELYWVSEEMKLPEETRQLLFDLRDIAAEVESAESADSAANRLRRIEAAARLVEKRRKAPGSFGTALDRWAKIIETAREETERSLRDFEPIPQVYQKSGLPEESSGRTDDQLTFKGRHALFRQLEDALGNRGGDRTTLLLYGQRRSGKTTLLRLLTRRLGTEVVPIVIDLQAGDIGGAKDDAGLLLGLATAIIEQARRAGMRTKPPDPDRQEFRQDPFPAFSRWLEELERKFEGRTLLLCLDEYEELDRGIGEGRFNESLLAQFRHLVQHNNRITVLFAGASQLNELPPRWASALINTFTLHISFLDEEDARELITRPVATFPSDLYEPQAVTFGNPP